MRLKTSASFGLILAGSLVVAACGSSTTPATSTTPTTSSSTSDTTAMSSTDSAMSGGSETMSGGSESMSGGSESMSGGSESMSGGSESMSGGSESMSGGSESMSGGSESMSGGSESMSGGSESMSGGSAGGGGGGSVGKVGVILPDTKSSARWDTADRPLLVAAFKAAGVDADVQNAQGSASTMATIADQMITSGVKVLAIVNLDNASGAAIEKKAASQGVKTLDYDRLTLGGSAEAYISFDNEKVGELQGQGLADALGDKDANIAYLNGSPDDSNATAFAAGAHKILDAKKNYKVVAEQAVPKWDNQTAATIFEQMFTKQQGKIDGVLAANDGLANAAIGVLSKNGVTVPVTGQDATVQGLQHILEGTQTMTVYKAVKKEAGALADAAIALAKGGKPATTGTVKDTKTGKDVPAVLLAPQSITKANVKDVVDDGYVKVAELCTGAFAAKCTAAGIK